MTTRVTLRDRAAAALDATHDQDGRGPRTWLARQRVAEWLDRGGRRAAVTVKAAIAWLELRAAERDAA